MWSVVTSGKASFLKVYDSQPPEFQHCPDNLISEAAPGTAYATVRWVEPLAADDRGVVKVVSTHSPGGSFEIGVTRVEYVAFDDYGNTGYVALRSVQTD